MMAGQMGDGRWRHWSVQRERGEAWLGVDSLEARRTGRGDKQEDRQAGDGAGTQRGRLVKHEDTDHYRNTHGVSL